MLTADNASDSIHHSNLSETVMPAAQRGFAERKLVGYLLFAARQPQL